MTTPTSYPVRCAWCRRIIGATTVAGSHGICPACRAQIEQEVTK
jgi:hypothetical protein